MRVVAFLQPGWADWEAGPVLTLLRRHFGAEVSIATPDGKPQTSIGGLTVEADQSFADQTEGDVLLGIGSDAWETFRDARFFQKLSTALAADKVVGLICGATIAGARAGLYEGRAHTSNGREWLAEQAPGYAGADCYADSQRAVSSGRLVTASGLAPVTFAAAVASLIAPGGADALKEYESLFAREWSG